MWRNGIARQLEEKNEINNPILDIQSVTKSKNIPVQTTNNIVGLIFLTNELPTQNQLMKSRKKIGRRQP